MPQHVRGQRLVPFRQWAAAAAARPARSVSAPALAAVQSPSCPLTRQQRGAVPGEVVAEQAPHVLDEPAQRPPAR